MPLVTGKKVASIRALLKSHRSLDEYVNGIWSVFSHSESDFEQRVRQYDRHPAGPFTILEPRDQEIGEFHVVVQESRATDFEASEL